VSLQPIRTALSVGRFTVAPDTAHVAPDFDMFLDPSDRIGLDIQKRVLFALNSICLLLATRIDPDHDRLDLTIGALSQHQVDDPAIMSFDGFALADKLSSASGMTGHEPLASRAQNG